jgi:hypothetical protein
MDKIARSASPGGQKTAANTASESRTPLLQNFTKGFCTTAALVKAGFFKISRKEKKEEFTFKLLQARQNTED